MGIQIFMAAIAGAAGLIGAVISVLTVRDKLRAEREFVRVLTTRAHSLRELRDRIIHEGVVTPAELEALVASFEAASESLPAEQRRLVVDGFRQRSLLGRARYVAKLMNKIGIGLGTMTVLTLTR